MHCGKRPRRGPFNPATRSWVAEELQVVELDEARIHLSVAEVAVAASPRALRKKAQIEQDGEYILERILGSSNFPSLLCNDQHE